MEGVYRRGNKEVPRDHKEDLVGPAAELVDEPQQSRIGESRKRYVFRHADTGGLEGPLKRVEYGNPGDRDQAQRFDGGISACFSAHQTIFQRVRCMNQSAM